MDYNISSSVGPSSDLGAAISSVPVGGGIVLAAGDYFLTKPLIVEDRFLRGSGADVTRIHGTVVLAGASVAQEIGVHAPKGSHAFDVDSGVSSLVGCAARLRPDAEAAALRVCDAELEIIDSVIDETDDRPALIASQTQLFIERSRVGYMHVGDESKASISKSTLVRCASTAVRSLRSMVPARLLPGAMIRP